MNSYNTARYRATGLWLYENLALVAGKVLDVGCGDKPYHRLFPDNEWVGLDMRPVGDVTGDMHTMPFEDESFDTVLCTDTLQWSLEPMKAIAEMYRVLKPGGNLVIIAPHTMPRETGLISYSAEGLKAAVEAVAQKPASAACGYGLMKQEYSRLGSRIKHAGGYPAEITGWLDQLDHAYPVIAIVTTQKE